MMNLRRKSGQRGYTLAEALVVMAIIGIISVVTVPNFISLFKAFKIKSAARQFAMDLRTARQRAVSKNRRTLVSIGTSTAEKSSYWMYEEDNGAWVPMKRTDGGPAGTGLRELPDAATQVVYFLGTGFKDTVDFPSGSARRDIIFNSNGTVGNIPAPPPTGVKPTVMMQTDAKIAKKLYTFELSAAGSVKTY